MAKKWIINKNRVCLGNVDFHSEFYKDNSETIGGGEWHIDKDANEIYFFGKSEDFGQVSSEQFSAAEMRLDIQNRGLKVYFSNELTLEAAIQERLKNVNLQLLSLNQRFFIP